MNMMKAASSALLALCSSGAYQATKYVSSREVARVTRRHRLSRRAKRVEFVVTLGQPNYQERAFIRRCRKAGEPLPVRKVQLKFKSGR